MQMSEVRCTLALCSLILLVGALPAAAATEDPGKSNPSLEEAAVSRSESELAEKILKQMMEDSLDVKEDPTAHELLGDAYQAQGHFDKATREYHIALELAEVDAATKLSTVPQVPGDGHRAAVELSKLFSTVNVNGQGPPKAELRNRL